MPVAGAFEKKEAYFKKVVQLFSEYSKVLIVGCDNVGSSHMQRIRRNLRGKAVILMGKNTLIRKVLKGFLEKHEGHPLEAFMDQILGNVGFVFTNADLPKVRDMILKNKVPAPARIGAIAPVDVTVPAGPTGCDPGQTSFFQVLQIPTKIVKGQIEITNNVSLVKKGDKVGSSEAALLNKLNIKPFSYGLSIKSIYDNGSIFTPDVLDITEEVLASRFSAALSQVAAISLRIGYPTQASIPHSVGNAFQSCVAIAVSLPTYSFAKADAFRAFLADPSAFASVGPAVVDGGDAGAAKPAAPAKPAEEEVDALEGGMDMFGGGGGGDY